MQYSTKVMEHFANPHNVGEIPDADGIGNVGNPVCGDIMRMYIKVKDGRITDAKFKTFGCGAAIATSSMATDLIKGKTIEEALAVTNKAVAEALGGLPPVKMHCSVLAEEALRKAIDDYLRKTTGQGLEVKAHEELVADHAHAEARDAPGESTG
jgi:nitrogen fixation NifU-like protein